MDICSNCFRGKDGDHIFCPWCGYPTGDIGLKQCRNGHIIFETLKNCPFCQQADHLGKAFLNAKRTERTPTELVRTVGVGAAVVESDTVDKTVLEDDLPDKTVLESGSMPGLHFPYEDLLGKTVVEDYIEKTRLDTSGGKTIVREPENEVPFFAWIVFTDDGGLPIHDIRLIKEKTIIGKGDDADIKITEDFVSRLHALIYLEKETFYISDLGSTNGTFVNEEKVMLKALNDGDHLRIGRKPAIFKRVTGKLS